MKKYIILCLITLFGMQFCNAQTCGKLSWEKKYGWEEGATNLISLDCQFNKNVAFSNFSKGMKSFVLVSHSQEGRIVVYEVNKDGSIGEKVSEKTDLKKGNWAMTVLPKTVKGNIEKTMSFKYYIMISYADYGQAEIYEFEKGGKIGERTWNTEKWEKGIKMISVIGNGVFLYKSDAGWAWIFDVDDNGKVGNNTWGTQGWVKGIDACGVCYRYLFLTKSDGRAWIFKEKDNKLEFKWETKTFDKGITTVASPATLIKDKVAICNPVLGKEWLLELELFEGTPKVTWEDKTGWEKGTSLQAFVNEGKHLLVCKPSMGRVWSFEVK